MTFMKAAPYKVSQSPTETFKVWLLPNLIKRKLFIWGFVDVNNRKQQQLFLVFCMICKTLKVTLLCNPVALKQIRYEYCKILFLLPTLTWYIITEKNELARLGNSSIKCICIWVFCWFSWKKLFHRKTVRTKKKTFIALQFLDQIPR